MSQSHPARQVPIAVVGVSALFPGSPEVAGFWKNVLEGRDLLSDVPPSHWLISDYHDPDPAAPDKTYGKRGGFLPPVAFDPLAFGVPPANVPATDTAQLLALIVAQKVLDDATQGQFAKIDRARASVVLGVCGAQELVTQMAGRLQRPVWLKALREAGIAEDKAQEICERIAAHYVPWQEASFPGLLGNVVAGRIANKFDLHGTNCVTDAACASALSALAMSINELALGQSDLVITGGVDTMNDPFTYMCFSKTPALSPSGDCRPFSDASDGTMLGEGLAMFALKRLADAQRDGDAVYAVLRGLGSSSDGQGTAIYAPLSRGQARALQRAYDGAGYGPDSVELVEAHGTGTKAGDLAEFDALRAVFDASARTDRQWCALGSVKSQIGHTKAAAGAAGLLKVVLALHHKVLPPTLKVQRPNPKLQVEASPFYLNTQARPWIHEPATPRRASVSSFGFGGSNFHATVEEYRPEPGAAARPARTLNARPSELVAVGAPNAAELVTRLRAMAADPRALAQQARESQRSFRADAPVRLALVAADRDELARLLGEAAAAIERAPDEAWSSPAGVHYRTGPPHTGTGGVAFLFSGQGSQYVGMGTDLAMHFPAARAAWDAAAALRFDGEALHRVVFPPPAFDDEARAAQRAHLTATEWAQPALAAQSLAVLGVLQALGLRPDAVAGHSLGELVALHCGGVFDREALLRIARRRGELMRDAAASVGPGAMVAVPLPRQEVESLLAQLGESEAVVANDNAPQQVVVSGSVAAVERVERALAARQVDATRLNVSTAFHSPLVAPAVAPFAAFLEGIEVAAPQLDVYGNTDAVPYSGGPTVLRETLAKQLASRVRFVDTIEAMHARGVRCFIEIGAGAALTDLVGRILGQREHLALGIDRKGKHGVTALQQALARLAVQGVAMDFEEVFWRDHAPLQAPTSARAPALTLTISGSNYGKPYPPPGGTSALPPPNPVTAMAPAAASPVEPAAAPAPAATAAAAAAAPPSDWLKAMVETQRLAIEAHTAFQREMAESHRAFLGMVGGTASLSDGAALFAAPETQPTPFFAAAPVPAPAPAPALVPPMPVAAAELPAPPAAVVDTAALVLSIVAEKTGYPVEMLSPQMELEADLGIDSIKRVEILSCLRERSAGLPELKPSELARLRSIADIAAALGAAPAPAPAPAPASAASAPAVPDLSALVLAVVAEKTGYPAEMLGPQMELEADLGIDSIKRVEILSSLRERLPGLPEMTPAELGKLRTIGDIATQLQGGAASSEPAPGAPSPATEPDTSAAPAALSRAVVRVQPAAAPGLALAGLGAAPLVVVDAGSGVGKALAATLCAQGVAARLAETMADTDGGLVYLGGLRDVATADEADLVAGEAFGHARAMAARMEAQGGVFVTVQDTAGVFGIGAGAGVRSGVGALAALARTAALEWPLAALKAIDCERAGRSADACARAIAHELLFGGSALDVGLRADGTRVVPLLQPANVSPVAKAALEPGDVVVATGGARGVTAAALVALAQRLRPRLVLIGRTPLADESAALAAALDEATIKRVLLDAAQRAGEPTTPAAIGAQAARVMAAREVRSTLAVLQAAGSSARYLALDVQDAGALAAALDDVRRDWGPIRGVVHGAGVLADRRIGEKTQQQFDRVYRTKVLGCRALLDATANDPLQLVCLFSSIAARTGNAGQSDYAMANEVLNLIAGSEHARRPQCAVLAIAWGAWQGGMVDAALAEHFQRRGVALIGLQAGAQAFVDEVCGAAEDAQVVIAAGLGTGALGAPATAALRAEVHLDLSRQTHLRDHSIGGNIVVPLALMLEWMLRAARSAFAPPAVPLLRGVRVLRKIGGAAFRRGGLVLDLTGKEEAGLLELQLASRGVAHCCATALASAMREPAPSVPPGPLGAFARSTVYDGELLFHGPRFRAIDSVDGISAQGAAGTLLGVTALGWQAEAWCCDPAAVDGALQLAVLWAEQVLGGASLPMGIDEVILHRVGPAGPTVQGLVRSRRVLESRAKCDISLVDPDGGVRMQLLGVALIKRPDLGVDRPGLEATAVVG